MRRNVARAGSETQIQIPFQFIRRFRHELSPVPQEVGEFITRDPCFTQHDGSHRMQFHFKLSDHAKIAATSAQSPKKSGIFCSAGVHNGAISGYNSEALDVVAREPMQPGEPAKSSTEDESGGARVRDYS